MPFILSVVKDILQILWLLFCSSEEYTMSSTADSYLPCSGQQLKTLDVSDNMAALSLSHMGKFKGSARFIRFCRFPAALVVSNSVLSAFRTVNFYLKFSSLFHYVAVFSHCFVISLV